MRGHGWYGFAGVAALLICGLIAVGCGDDDESTSTTGSTAESATQTVDAAVKSCTDEAQQLGGAAGTALASACTSVGNTAKQAVSSGSANAQEALSKAEDSCNTTVDQLPSGQAQDALTQLCDSISSAE